MRRIAVLLALCTVAAAAAALPALAADGPVQQFRQNVTLGFYRGDVVSYLDFGPVKLARGNRVAPIWVVTNGVEAQRNIVGTLPGRRRLAALGRPHRGPGRRARHLACFARRPGS